MKTKSTEKRLRLGELLVAEGKLSLEQLQSVLAEQIDRFPHARLGSLLREAGLVSANDLYSTICKQVGLPASIF